ncbi:MAG: glutamine--fructose-6-phosphate aminotransferase, partial [Candidatus Thiodiazotropha sp. (ex Lucinoma annulata)]|nr:glutamine--fructose-6-phosphate aminotransferase [Candidatus Thiodiazotropha sp. (ex Lucinoma annulata)]
MCGIVGGIAQRDIVPILMEGLKRLEYRGYDSAGVAVLDEHQHIQRIRSVGKVASLKDLIDGAALSSKLGIAHTRW